jgi:hypothetical protein
MVYKTMQIIIIFALMLIMVSPALAAPADDAVAQAASWLKGQQNADGGFSNGFTPDSSASTTAEAIIALAAGGQDAGRVQSTEGASPLDYLYQQVSTSMVDGVGATAKVVLALLAAGIDPTGFAGQDLVGDLEAAYEADSGSYGSSVFDQALVVLALANAGRTVPEGATDYLIAFQTADGAWNFMGDTAALTGDTNTTALVIQALVASGRKDDTGRGLAYLQRVQNDDGGWPYQSPSAFGTETDANSTALVLQAIYAVGQEPGDWYLEGTDPLGALLALQNTNGSFSYQASFPGDNALATVQAIPAAAGVTLASVRRTPTIAAPGIVVAAPPSTLPVAGENAVPATSGFLLIGLTLLIVGRLLKQIGQQTTRQ